MFSKYAVLSTRTPGNVLRVSAVLGLTALTSSAWGALQTVGMPSQFPTQTSQAVQDGNARLVLTAASQGYLGVTVHDVDPARAQKEKLATLTGAEVVSLDHDAPAAKAGIHTGDIIQAINGQVVTDTASLTRLLRDMPVGKFVDLQVVHNAKVVQVHLQLADRTALVQHAWAHHFHVPIPEPAPIVNGFAGGQNYEGDGTPPDGDTDSQAYVGAHVEPLTAQLAKHFGSQAGNGLLVSSIEDKSPAANAGLDVGDLIVSANGMPLETTADWLQTLRVNAGHPVALVVLRNRKVLHLAITIDARITQSDFVIPDQWRRLRESLDRYTL